MPANSSLLLFQGCLFPSAPNRMRPVRCMREEERRRRKPHLTMQRMEIIQHYFIRLARAVNEGRTSPSTHFLLLWIACLGNWEAKAHLHCCSNMDNRSLLYCYSTTFRFPILSIHALYLVSTAATVEAR
ncbi:hypothetical protein GQ54DRAFT_64588 [Martensiomyces pterosporus]|nr:hypothetical protein GQ54DRAFT_64588 [Martensiomyces pterosporus]